MTQQVCISRDLIQNVNHFDSRNCPSPVLMDSFVSIQIIIF